MSRPTPKNSIANLKLQNKRLPLNPACETLRFSIYATIQSPFRKPPEKANFGDCFWLEKLLNYIF